MLLMSANGRNKFQSPHPVRGATEGYREGPAVFCISIHAPREGGDRFCFLGQCNRIEFQSTLPVRGATIETIFETGYIEISIHAPREGSDRWPR